MKQTKDLVKQGLEAKKTKKRYSLVDIYGLENIVRDKRAKGKSYREIARDINDAHVIPDDRVISHSAIARWCNDHNLSGSVDMNTEDNVVNIYNTKVKALRLVNTAIDTVSVELDELDKRVGNGDVDVNDLKSTIDMLDKLTLRQQALANEIGVIQEKVYRYENIEKAMNIINDVLIAKLSKDDYEDVMRSFSDSPMLLETLRKIAPSNA